ncbi:MAG: hypothetical protein HOY78_12560, partial [Saccharothrix sp.]|nr:hypothetical protein [Saccharothrix sp.]
MRKHEFDLYSDDLDSSDVESTDFEDSFDHADDLTWRAKRRRTEDDVEPTR